MKLRAYTPADLARAQEAYRRLHGGAPAPAELSTMEAPRVAGVLVELGSLENLGYLTRKDTGRAAGKVAIHQHRFSPSGRPVLAVNADGRLVIVGGSYVVTERGIVG